MLNPPASEVGTELAIRARGLGKSFKIGTKAEAKLSSRVVAALGGAPARRTHWALRGVDLEVRRGECVGIIGRNGAGKSTLLMTLAGLLEPTEGSVEVRGTVSPFFQIGSGLHSDLSVLDNIRLACALFGMSAETARERLAAIVAFGELEQYLYARLGELSQGYQSRVPYSVALHSDIDILITDEVFAVGDAVFIERSIERMSELMGQGRTVVMASHSMELVQHFCTRAVLIEAGRIAHAGPSEEVVERYLGPAR